MSVARIKGPNGDNCAVDGGPVPNSSASFSCSKGVMAVKGVCRGYGHIVLILPIFRSTSIDVRNSEPLSCSRLGIASTISTTEGLIR